MQWLVQRFHITPFAINFVTFFTNHIRREWSLLKNILIFAYFPLVLSIRCYQCSSQQDRKGIDSCGAYKRFNKTQHIAIECNSDESHMPGSFCMKVVQQGPRGFICKIPFFLIESSTEIRSLFIRGRSMATSYQTLCIRCRDWCNRRVQLGCV